MHSLTYLSPTSVCTRLMPFSFNASFKPRLEIKVETNGQEGVKNELTQDDIDHCKCIIVAADKKVEMQRFEGKKLIQVPVRDGISKAEELGVKTLSESELNGMVE